MEITAESKQGILIIRLEGASLDTKEADPFLSMATHWIDEEPNSGVILDLHGIDYIDRAGLASFRSLYKKLKDQNKKLVLVSAEKSVRTVLEIVSLDKVLPLYQSVEEALETWKQPQTIL